MGTNFYQETENGSVHLGKRSGAGPFCWNCHQTLCKGGIGGVHYSRHGWHSECPNCGEVLRKNIEHSVGSDLGPRQESKRTLANRLAHGPNHHRSATGRIGVQTVCSFSWAIHPCNVGDGWISDEYGNVFTKQEFINILLDQCPIQFYGSLEEEFF